MLQITVHDRTYRLATETSLAGLREAVLNAMRTAPAFLKLQTAGEGSVEVSIAATTPVVLEEHDDSLPEIPFTGFIEPDYDDLYDLTQ
jgi:hypothetical protein